MGPHCMPQRLLKHSSRREKQTTFVAIVALRVNKINCRQKCMQYHPTYSEFCFLSVVTKDSKKTPATRQMKVIYLTFLTLYSIGYF